MTQSASQFTIAISLLVIISLDGYLAISSQNAELKSRIISQIKPLAHKLSNKCESYDNFLFDLLRAVNFAVLGETADNAKGKPSASSLFVAAIEILEKSTPFSADEKSASIHELNKCLGSYKKRLGTLLHKVKSASHQELSNNSEVQVQLPQLSQEEKEKKLAKVGKLVRQLSNAFINSLALELINFTKGLSYPCVEYAKELETLLAVDGDKKLTLKGLTSEEYSDQSKIFFNRALNLLGQEKKHLLEIKTHKYIEDLRYCAQNFVVSAEQLENVKYPLSPKRLVK